MMCGSSRDVRVTFSLRCRRGGNTSCAVRRVRCLAIAGGEGVLVLGWQDVGEPARHAAAGAGRRREQEVERAAGQRPGAGGVDLEGGLHSGHEQPLVRSGGLLQGVDHVVCQPQFVEAVQEDLLHQREQQFVAVGAHLQGGSAFGADVSGGQPEAAVGDQVHHRHQGADAVPGPEPAMVVAPVLIAVGLRGGPVES